MANSNSDSPDISGDGRLVAFRSAATNLVPGDSNGVPDIFVFDRMAGTMSVATISRFGNHTADNRSLRPMFAGGGQTLLFESVASDLAGYDFNAINDIFSWTLDTSVLQPFSVNIVNLGQGFQINWPAFAGRTHQVQFKNSLADPSWQNLLGNVMIVGNTASFRDATPAGNQRYYRVLVF